jgi:hypothetical protein
MEKRREEDIKVVKTKEEVEDFLGLLSILST